MQRTKPPTFRPTSVRLWPADPGELPRVDVYSLDVHGDHVRWMGRRGEVEVPLDFVLREPLDVPDELPDDAVVVFMNRWGPLTAPGLQAFDQLPKGERGGLQLSEVDWRVDVQRHHLQVLATLARHYLVHAAGGDVREAWGSGSWNEPRSIEEAWSWWADYMNAALAGFSMHVVVDSEGEVTRGSTLDFSHATIYAVAARQLGQLASEGEQIRHCANVRCGRPFTRQRGRASYGQQHATGVLYCSRECARAQAERARRARRASERQASTA